MGLFGNFDNEDNETFEEEFVFDEDAEIELEEMFTYDQLSQELNSDELREAFFDSELPEQMLEAGLVSKKTLVRLSKKDDLSRRKKMVVLQMAKDANDPMYHQLVKIRKKERELLGKIYMKYSNRATSVAAKGQKEYLKGNKLVPLNFVKSKNLDSLGNRIGKEINKQGFRRAKDHK